VAEAFGVDPATIWRWDQALACGGVAGLVPVRRGPKGASKLTPALAARIAGLDAAGQTLRQIAAATGVSTFTIRAALGQAAGPRPPAVRPRPPAVRPRPPAVRPARAAGLISETARRPAPEPGAAR
jgi:lambda repressor-like predicted transcriptional regulator